MQRKQIVVVEDDPDILKIVAATLQEHEFEVAMAMDGRTGLELIRETQPHAVVMDIMMPEMNGIDVLRALKQSEDTSDIPVILLTVKSDINSKISGFVAGASRYMTKPFDIDDLVSNVRNAIQQKSMKQQQYSIYDTIR